MKKRAKKAALKAVPWALYVGSAFWGRVPSAKTAEEAIKKYKKASNGMAANLDLTAVPLERL